MGLICGSPIVMLGKNEQVAFFRTLFFLKHLVGSPIVMFVMKNVAFFDHSFDCLEGERVSL